MARCVTDWVAPGKGATVSEVAALCGKTVQDDRRTSLAIVRPGEVMDYDCQRAEVVLARLDGEFKPEPLPRTAEGDMGQTLGHLATDEEDER